MASAGWALVSDRRETVDTRPSREALRFRGTTVMWLRPRSFRRSRARCHALQQQDAGRRPALLLLWVVSGAEA